MKNGCILANVANMDLNTACGCTVGLQQPVIDREGETVPLCTIPPQYLFFLLLFWLLQLLFPFFQNLSLEMWNGNFFLAASHSSVASRTW